MSSVNNFGSRRLYRDRERGVILGVCAGVADYFGFDVAVTRILVVASLFLFFPTTVLIYFVLALILPKKPKESGVGRDEVDSVLQRRVRSEPHGTLQSVRHRFRELDSRLQRLEKYVTSNRFKLDREFESLKD